MLKICGESTDHVETPGKTTTVNLMTGSSLVVGSSPDPTTLCSSMTRDAQVPRNPGAQAPQGLLWMDNPGWLDPSLSDRATFRSILTDLNVNFQRTNSFSTFPPERADIPGEGGHLVHRLRAQEQRSDEEAGQVTAEGKDPGVPRLID